MATGGFVEVKGVYSSASTTIRGPPVSVVEDHDEALHVIYRAIGSKKLPLSGTTLVHFDAHPDLLSPELPADEFTDKERLYANTSIGEWILPAVYMGHIECVVWLKPPWSQQIHDGEYPLVLGRDKKNGFVRVATPLSYYISDRQFSDLDSLTNTRTIPLHVLTLPVIEEDLSLPSPPLPPPPSSPSPRPTPPLSSPSSSPNIPPLLARAESILSQLLSNKKPWILDFDLDFFSTANPFKDNFSLEEYSFLETLYKFVEPKNSTHESVCTCVKRREEQLETLDCLWKQSNDEEKEVERAVGQSFTASQRKMLSPLRRKIGEVYDGTPLEAEDIHLAGMMTDLPHHPATQTERDGLLAATSHLLSSLSSSTCATPSLVTVARSTDDGYTPTDHVEQLQDKVVGVVSDLYRCHANLSQ